MNSKRFYFLFCSVFVTVILVKCNLFKEEVSFPENWQLTETDMRKSNKLYIKDSIKMIALNIGEGKQTRGYIVVLNEQNKVKGYISNGNPIVSMSNSLIEIETPSLSEEAVSHAPKEISVKRIALCGCLNTIDNMIITDFKLIGPDSVWFQYRYDKLKTFANQEFGKDSIQNTHPDIGFITVPIGSQLSYSYKEKGVYFYTFKNNCWYGKFAQFENNAKAELFFETLFKHFMNHRSAIDGRFNR